MHVCVCVRMCVFCSVANGSSPVSGLNDGSTQTLRISKEIPGQSVCMYI